MSEEREPLTEEDYRAFEARQRRIEFIEQRAREREERYQRKHRLPDIEPPERPEPTH